MINTVRRDSAFVVIGAFYIIIMAVSIPANILILLAMGLNKKLQTPINILVGNLSVAGLAIAILRMPFKIYELFNPDASFILPTSFAMCRFQQILPAASVLCISITLTTICVDRYLAIMYPMKQYLKMTLTRVYIFLPISWGVSFACFGPYASIMTLQTINDRVYCFPIYPKSPADINITNSDGDFVRLITASNIVLWGLFIPIAFLIPSIIMATLYFIIVRHLWYGEAPGDKVKTVIVKERAIRQKQKQRVVKLLIICCLIFILTNLPYYAVFMLLDFGFLQIPRSDTTIVTNSLIIINLSAVAYNPIIYGYFNRSIKKAVDNLLRRIQCKPPIEEHNFVDVTCVTRVPNGHDGTSYLKSAAYHIKSTN
ncbi:putative G-protein coupled receptor 83 [Trichoplax sp. H2]|uniref:G-protein coupled receptors family 1 profile domain-containing protein n=1 Tax=Trichoplax adhaerens TaxID=10228 RepID=B3S4W5_TRIAD|nr:hypothetical protein TRIADDRAFT_59370 [Trichoplax adhaerens]EDV22162.1 hypothetical protein TRIADDRAFT_59370 [Trichoplax adhaerens]RDD37923.1 putative G-protein coupled receptor 83 [Trichoplax sp. H2]|eukprot:XP_002115317.1 hypothetical protein TRIADDRAFT_59370 [Trichoplax adhaerens]